MKTIINSFKPLNAERVVVIVLGAICLAACIIGFGVAIHAVATGQFHSHIAL